jgi:brefeldin A-inhibited guanine nucleotide-exchange protein
LSTSALSVSGTMDTSVMGLSENQLKRQGLECLVAVLRSLVAWGTATGKMSDDPLATPSSRPHLGEDARRDSIAPDQSSDKLSAGASVEALRQPTPDLMDDPSKFESAKQKKTTLLEGIKKFNFKPKRVGLLYIRPSPLLTTLRAFNSSSTLDLSPVTLPKILRTSFCPPTV